jgi:CBS domain-containing protein
MLVKDVMSTRVATIRSVTMLPEAAQILGQENVGVLPVEDNGKLVGMVTDRDITVQAVAKGDVNCPVSDVMTTNPVTITSQTTTKEAIRLMEQSNVRRLPVVDNDRIVGIVSFEDLVEGGDDQAIIHALHTFHQQTRHA